MRGKNFATLSMSLVISLFCCFLLVHGNVFEKKYDEEEGKAYLKKINADIQVKTTESVLASWAYESNITDENLRHQLDVSAKLANYTKEIWKETIKYPWKKFSDPDARRQFQKFSVLGTAILSPPKYKRFNKIISDMQSVYGKAKICNYYNRSDCNMQLEPELTEVFVKSRDPNELRYYWEEWRNAAGKPVREMYKEYVDLSNEAAVLNNFTDNAEFWLKDYEAKDFKEQVEALWQQLRPLYLQLHAFVRRRLREQYGEKHVTKRGPIPAHLLGNMWAQSWGNIFDFTVPYPGKPSMDVTPTMLEQGYTPLRMFKLAEEFFTSLNLSPMPDTFWKNSILEKPNDGRDLICHASAWDFYDGKDFRIKQCTRITMEDLNTVHHEMGHIQYFLQYKNQPLVYKEGTNPGRIIEPRPEEEVLLIKQCTRVTFRQLVTVHHEMGHIQYYLQYKNQPKIYRRGANPGFHEAVGDVMALSVSTPKHLRKIGLLNATEDDAESEINQLYNMALDKIAFLPFGYLMDQWRWSVFEGKTTEKEYNCKWWQLREKYQGLSPSVIRTEDDFDPGAKYHTVGNVPYIRYFVSFVIQFQFHRSLCIAAKEFDPNDPASKPLHKCDIYQSKEAGALLKEMLQMGSSKPWPDAMEVMTGQRKMDASALLEYFAALQDWLEKENERTGEFIGWESSQKECSSWEDGDDLKPTDSQGNFEDDNIAFSYAEFVRQDDNSFGFPDYLEEVQPSYQALRHRSKKNEFPANYFLTKRNVRKFSKTKNLFPPSGKVRNEYIDMQNFNKISENESTFSNGEGYTLPNRRMRQSTNNRQQPSQKDINLMNAILKNIQYMSSRKGFGKESKSYKWVKSRETLKGDKNLTTEDTRSEFKSGEIKKTVVKGEVKEKSKLETDKIAELSENEKDTKENPNDDLESQENQVELEVEKGRKLLKDDEIVYPTDQERKLMSKDMETLKSPDDLMWKAELIKNEAERMLRNFNLSAYSSNMSYFSKLPFETETSFHDENNYNGGLCQKKTRNILPLYHTAEYFKPVKNVKLRFNSLGNFLKNDRSLRNREESQNHLHFKEYDLVGVIPVDHLLVENDPEGKKRHVQLSENSDNSYVMLVGKLSEKHSSDSGIGKKKQKKSYKEYHYSPKIPVFYNSVIICPGGKTDKTDDGKDRLSLTGKRKAGISESKRNSREAKNSRKNAQESILMENRRPLKFSKNILTTFVKNNKFNKNNIVQYLGCLQLLL